MFGKKTSSDGSQPSKPQQQPQQQVPSEPQNMPMGGTAHLPATIEKQQQNRDELVSTRTNSLDAQKSQSPNAFNIDESSVELLKYTDRTLETPVFLELKKGIIADLVDKIDITALYKLNEDRRKQRVFEEAGKILEEKQAPLTGMQIKALQEQCLDEILGFGPMEPLLKDPEVSDIMINTAKQVYIEKSGRIYLTDITFMNEQHLMAIVQRIVTRVGRRIDEASPMVDARLPDGSRFNAIIPPLALDGALVSIRKFKKSKISLREYVNYESLTPQMAQFLEICGNIRLNIIISGGTGSGKTTMLNALSNYIDLGERVITIEDAAELQMAQPHVLRLETRPASNEGTGEVTQRELVKNALRMRPDRIILGEIRGSEVIDLLTAMNTGHDGSLATIHSNTPRDCLARIENLVNMSGVAVSNTSLRYQISSALQLIIQLQRMRDGKRRVTHIEEVVGLEGDVIVTQTLFSYKASGVDAHGNLLGEYVSHGIRPRFKDRADYFGRGQELAECLGLIRG